MKCLQCTHVRSRGRQRPERWFLTSPCPKTPGPFFSMTTTPLPNDPSDDTRPKQNLGDSCPL